MKTLITDYDECVGLRVQKIINHLDEEVIIHFDDNKSLILMGYDNFDDSEIKIIESLSDFTPDQKLEFELITQQEYDCELSKKQDRKAQKIIEDIDEQEKQERELLAQLKEKYEVTDE